MEDDTIVCSTCAPPVALAALHLSADRAEQAAAVLASLRDVWDSAANTIDGAEAATLASLLGERAAV